MHARCAALAGLTLAGLVCCSPVLGQVSARAAGTPLQLALQSHSDPRPATTRQLHRPVRQHSLQRNERPGLIAEQRHDAREQQRELGRRALELVLADESSRESAGLEPGARAQHFKFERKGNAVRDLSRGYRDMCAKVSQKIWDEPNGRQIKFDVAGKPGVAMEIPLR